MSYTIHNDSHFFRTDAEVQSLQGGHGRGVLVEAGIVSADETGYDVRVSGFCATYCAGWPEPNTIKAFGMALDMAGFTYNRQLLNYARLLATHKLARFRSRWHGRELMDPEQGWFPGCDSFFTI